MCLAGSFLIILIQFQVTSVEPSYPSSASCPLRVVAPLGLTILHPPPRNGTLYLQPNDTRLLLRVQSRYLTKVSRRGSNRSVTFQPEAPAEFLSALTLCQPGPSSDSGVDSAEPSLYAVLDLTLGVEEKRGPVQVELEAHNNVTEASLMVVVHIEEPLRGLMVQPHPAHRVLMESVVVSMSLFSRCIKSSNRILHSVCVLCFRATQHLCLKAPTPHLNGLWMTNHTSPITTLC